MTSKGLKVRWHDKDDLPRLVEIFNECFPAERWTERDLIRFAKRKKAGVKTNVLKVLTYFGQVTGALLYTLTDDECRIRRVCVASEFRRHGFGRFLVNFLLGAASPIRRKLFTARVREDYVEGLLFLRDGGFGFAFDPDAPRFTYRDTREGYTFFTHREVTVPQRLVLSTI